MKTLTTLFLAALLCGRAALAQAPDALTRERDEQTGTAITILFDNSGSMNEEHKIPQAKAAFSTWLKTVPADYKFSLITFEDRGRLIVPLGENTRETVAKKVSQLIANTSTPICGALEIAREQIEKRRREVTPYERQVVLIFTDGQETVDSRGIDGVREEITKLRNAMVEVVGVGFHGQGDYMNGVATRFALANDEKELQQGLAKVDAEVGSADDIAISQEDLMNLKTFHVPPPPALAGATATAREEDSAKPSPGVSERSLWKSPVFLVILAVLVSLLMRDRYRRGNKSWLAFVVWFFARLLTRGKATPEEKRKH